MFNYQNRKFFALRYPIKSFDDLILHIVHSQFKALGKQTTSICSIFKISQEICVFWIIIIISLTFAKSYSLDSTPP